MYLLEQYLIKGRSNSEPISLENIGKRVIEDVSFEEHESIPPAKVERKKSPVKKELRQAAPDWAQLIYNEILEIKLQVRNFKGEIRNEINDFKQIMEREQQELKSSIQLISDQYDSLKTSQQTNEEKCVTLKNENICTKGTISNLLNKINELEQYSRRNCLLVNGIKEIDPMKTYLKKPVKYQHWKTPISLCYCYSMKSLVSMYTSKIWIAHIELADRSKGTRMRLDQLL